MLQPPIRLAYPPLLAATLLLACGTAFGQNAQTLQIRSLAATCANCHGTDGKALQGDAMTPLAGMPTAYIVSQMQDFKEGKRPATIMHQLAKGYSNEQIEAIAAYFASKK